MGLILQCLFSPAISLHVFVYVVVLLELVLEQIKRRSAFGNRRCSSKISSSRSEAAVAGFLLVSSLMGVPGVQCSHFSLYHCCC